jgi:hypothetical protein
MTPLSKIILSNAGVETSNGEYVFDSTYENGLRFNSENKNHIEKTIDGWMLIDFSENDQTYAFDEDFENALLAGDAKEPAPTIQKIF